MVFQLSSGQLTGKSQLSWKASSNKAGRDSTFSNPFLVTSKAIWMLVCNMHFK